MFEIIYKCRGVKLIVFGFRIIRPKTMAQEVISNYYKTNTCFE